MKEKIRKTGTPIAIFLFFSILTLFVDESSFLVDESASNTFHIIYGYIVQIGMVLSGAFLFNRIMNVVIWDKLIARMIGASVPRLIKDLFATLIVVVGITIIVGVIFRKSVTGIWVTSSTIGFILGFALRSLILDVFTGLAINIDGSYKINDWIHVHSRNTVEYIGCIVEMNWRTIRLKTTENNVVVVPNSIMGQSVVSNFSVPDALSRFELFFHLDFSILSERAVRVLLAGVNGAIGYKGIEDHPEPTVKINQVTDKGVEYMVRYWIYPAKTSPSRARHVVTQSILHSLSTAGISLAYPKQDVFYSRMPARDLDAQSKEGKRKILSSIELFRNIRPEALNILTESLKIVTFNASEKVIKIGEKGSSMFVIIEGFLDVYVYNETEKREVKIGNNSAGEFFGEMALLTGQPRSATVIAVTDVIAYEITRENMMPLVNSYPEILETISQVVAERQVREQYFLEHTNKQELTKETQNLTEEILARIVNFFGLVKHTVTHRRKTH